jgi:SAM-dependent methyltransferase
MRPDLLDLLRCPACGCLALRVAEGELVSVPYASGPCQEIACGSVLCGGCEARYPVRDYVLSFEERLAPGVRADGDYWGAFYAAYAERGLLGFMDTRHPPVPFLGQGVTRALPMDGEEWGGIHVQLAESSLVRPGGRVLDVGVGAGWSSLFLARRGFDTIAFDPSFELVRLAKAHAMRCGVRLEYMCADMASVSLRDGCLDAAFALHSLHHIPNVFAGLDAIHRMLRVGGALAVDDHFQDAPPGGRLQTGLFGVAAEQIFPQLREGNFPALPPASEHEGVGLGQVLPAIERYLHVETISYRHVCLDMLPALHYLDRGGDRRAYDEASAVTELLRKAMSAMWPDDVEYVTLLATKREQLPAAPRHAPGPLSNETRAALVVQQHERELERLHRVVAEKNAHIAELERTIERLSNGRAMRLLRWAARRQ